MNLEEISRNFGIGVETGVATASLSGSVISGKWTPSPKVWTPRSWPRSIAEELLNSVESVSVTKIPDAVVEFTKKYGVLTVPFKRGEAFRFTVSEWLGKRAELEATWQVVSSLRRGGEGRPIRVSMDKGEYFEFCAGSLGFRTNHLDTYVSLEIAAVAPFRLRICENRLNSCKSPYFIANDLRHRYCSDICSQAAVREAKLRWWNENRREPRKEKPLQEKMNVARKTR